MDNPSPENDSADRAMRRLKFWAAMALWILAIFVAIELASIFYRCSPVEIFDYAVTYIGRLEWLDQFQTLITGITAGIIAWLAVRETRRSVQRQIEQAQSAETARLAKEEARQRAWLKANLAITSLAVANMLDYARANFDALWLQWHRNPNRSDAGNPQQFKSIPEGIVPIFKELIEAMELNDRKTLPMIELLRIIQRQDTNLGHRQREHAFTRSHDGDDFDVMLQAEIYARTYALALYAQDHSKEIPDHIWTKDIRMALHDLGVGASVISTLPWMLNQDRRWDEYPT